MMLPDSFQGAEEAAAARKKLRGDRPALNGRELFVGGAISIPPRAELLPVPGRSVRLEVRPCPLADRLHYVGQIAMAEDEADVSVRKLWPILVIPSTWAPIYDAQGVWRPGESTHRVFHWTDAETLLQAPGKLLEDLFAAAVRLCGLTREEEEASFWRLAKDGDFGTLMHIAYEWGVTLAELCQRMPSYELTWWRSYISKRNADMELDRASAAGGSESTFLMPNL